MTRVGGGLQFRPRGVVFRTDASRSRWSCDGQCIGLQGAVYVSENVSSLAAGTIAPLLSSTEREMNSHEDRPSWFMECELGAEGLRPRWGRCGGGVAYTAQTAVCVAGVYRHCDLPSSPPPPPPTAALSLLLACSLILRSIWPPSHSFGFWWPAEVQTRSPCGCQRLVLGRDVLKCPRWLQGGTALLCVCVGRQTSFISHGGSVDGGIIHQACKYLLWFQSKK